MLKKFVSGTQAPKFYVPVPPAPAGLEWWRYADDVPPLPDPSVVLGPLYARYGWRFEADYQARSYVFSNLDKVGLFAFSLPVGTASQHQMTRGVTHAPRLL